MSTRLAQFKERRPDAYDEWSRLLSPLMGFAPKMLDSSPFARASCDDPIARLLASQFGDPEPVVPTSVASVP